MKVFLSEAKPGMIVKFRCGGYAIIETVDGDDDGYDITFQGSTEYKSYKSDGYYFSENSPDVIDIIEIKDIKDFVVPVPEQKDEWDEMKPEAAFYNGEKIYYFMAKDPSKIQEGKEKYCLFAGRYDLTKQMFSDAMFIKVGSLTRTPEHDAW